MTETKVTVAIPFRPGSLDREIHYDYVKARLAELLPGAEHLTVDVDGQFSRARVRNEAVRRARGDVVVLCDADTVPEATPLHRAIAGATEDGRLHLPYNQFRGLSAESTLAVYARGLDPHQVPATEVSMRPIGGVWVIRADAWWRAGGMDEKFVGWGFEDDAFHVAANTLLGETVRHAGAITHLYHTPAVNQNSATYKANRSRFSMYQRARHKVEQMRNLVGVSQERPLRIAAIAHYYPPGHLAGAELMLHRMLKALAERGHDVRVWATDEDKAADFDGIRVRTGTPTVLDADVVISHLKSVKNAQQLARRAGAAFVQILHSAAPWVAADLRLRTQLYVPNSHHVAADLRLTVRGQYLVVHPPVDAAEHATTPGECVTLINPIPDKGADIFYALAERMPQVSFLAVEGGYQRHDAVRRDDLPNVTWVDQTTDMRRDVWARTKVLLMPSTQESYGLAAVEAAASGIPTIAHPTAGLKESLGRQGIFVDRADLDGWEQTLTRVLGPGWAEASAQALKRSGELDPTKELERWGLAIEKLAPSQRKPGDYRRPNPGRYARASALTYGR